MRNWKLISERKEKGFTQADISKQLNMSELTYRNKESDKSEFKINEINEIAKILNLSKEKIINIFFSNK